jgi:hypothetical protein
MQVNEANKVLYLGSGSSSCHITIEDERLSLSSQSSTPSTTCTITVRLLTPTSPFSLCYFESPLFSQPPPPVPFPPLIAAILLRTSPCLLS